MTQGGGTTEQIRGRVEQTNDKGLKIDGRWFNWSQYSRSTVRPDEGDDVELEIARGKFINDARIVGKGEPGFVLDDDDPFGGALPEPPGAGAASGPSRTTRPARSAPASAPYSQSSTPNADRNVEIRRLALIKAAADYAAGREMTPEEVVTLAAQWEEWVISRL
jgi:hypothetical protein